MALEGGYNLDAIANSVLACVMENVAESWRSPVSADDATRRLIFESSGHTAMVSIHPKQLLNILMDVVSITYYDFYFTYSIIIQ